MDNHLKVMKRVGWALVALGLLDIALMVYCILHAQNYSSSLNLFAVVAGAFLIKGHLGAARIVTWWSAFLFTGAGGGILFFLLVKPYDLWLTEMRLKPGGTILGLLAFVVVLAVLLWTYRELRSSDVLQARAAAGQSIAPPKMAFAAGALILVGFAPLFLAMTRGETAAKVLKLAEAKAGVGFKYDITSLNFQGEHGTASVTAYNESEIKSIDVEW